MIITEGRQILIQVVFLFSSPSSKQWLFRKWTPQSLLVTLRKSTHSFKCFFFDQRFICLKWQPTVTNRVLAELNTLTSTTTAFCFSCQTFVRNLPCMINVLIKWRGCDRLSSTFAQCHWQENRVHQVHLSMKLPSLYCQFVALFRVILQSFKMISMTAYIQGIVFII